VTAIFVTATGTDVGKTFIVAALIRHLRQLGHQVDAIKPIATGFDPARAATSDPGVLLAALGLPYSPEEVDRVSPWRFRTPLTPDLAAARENRRIDVDQVIAFCKGAVEQRREILLIESVGGVMTPLDGHRTILDVMMAVRLPLILVTDSAVGSISHTLTALDSLFRRDMNVLATIVVETPDGPMPLDDAVATIARFAEPVLGVPSPRHQGGDSAAGPAFGRLFGGQGRPVQRDPQKR
jgi:dethiobiotin synthetase